VGSLVSQRSTAPSGPVSTRRLRICGGVTSGPKLAVTAVLPSSSSSSTGFCCPESAPPQPLSSAPKSGWAVSVTVVPQAKLAPPGATSTQPGPLAVRSSVTGSGTDAASSAAIGEALLNM